MRQQRADGQIDVAGDDHKHHSRCHNGHGHGLDCQVENIARRQKPAFGQDIEHDANGEERAHHPEQTQVNFEGLKEAAFGLALL